MRRYLRLISIVFFAWALAGCSVFGSGAQPLPGETGIDFHDEAYTDYLCSTPAGRAKIGLPSGPAQGRPASFDDLPTGDLDDANLDEADLSQADLHGRNLHYASLRCADLDHADLRGAHLDGADLRGAYLNGAQLQGASITKWDGRDADLFGADLSNADLSHAKLFGANLTSAKFSSTTLVDTNLRYTHLRSAYLGSVNLKDTRFDGSDLTNAFFFPEAQDLPNKYLVGITGLAAVLLPHDPYEFIQLQLLFKAQTLTDEERDATFSIQYFRTEDELGRRCDNAFYREDGSLTCFSRAADHPSSAMDKLEGALRFIFLDETVRYGDSPTRALGIIIFLWLVGSLVYSIPIRRLAGPRSADSEAPEEAGRAASGIYIVLPADRIEDGSDGPMVARETRVSRIHEPDLLKALGSAAYFSLLSAVNIGFEQFEPGDWIRRLQKQEYMLEAVGWVRVVAGAQSLASVYLLAMWVLTQFGSPFD